MLVSEVEPPDAWLEVSNIAWDNSSQTSAVMLMWLSALGGCSMARWEGEDGVEVLRGAEASGTWFPSVTQERSTDRNDGSWMGVPNIFTPWANDAVRSKHWLQAPI